MVRKKIGSLVFVYRLSSIRKKIKEMGFYGELATSGREKARR